MTTPEIFGLRLAITEPIVLGLLALLPAFAIIALAGAGRASRGRRIGAVAIRWVILSALILSLSGARITQATDEIAVVFLIDASDSVGASGIAEAESLVDEALQALPEGDRSAVVLFGEGATVERALTDAPSVGSFGSRPTSTATDIAGAVRLALALFPDDAAHRIVLISDGEQNRGDLEAAAMLASANGAQIATVQLQRDDGPDTLVAAIHAPPRARAGDVVEISVTVESMSTTDGTLRLSGDGALLSEQAVTLQPGTNSFTVPINVGDRGFRAFRASVSVPSAADTIPQNNELSAFTEVSGPAAALILEGVNGEGAALADALRAGGIAVEVLPAASAPTDLPGYAGYDATILVNVPAQTLGQRMVTIQQYVRDLGRGLVAIGGDNSYGLGGYFETPLEETLPVRSDVRDPQRIPQVSVDFVLDKSGSMGACHGTGTDRTRVESGIPKTDLAKEASWQAIQMLGPTDEVGIVAFDSAAVWIAETAPREEQGDLASALAGIVPGGDTNIYAGLDAAVESLSQSNGRVKHIILITDGWSDTGDFEELIQRMRDDGITLSIIGAGGGAAEFLTGLAERGGGRFYAVDDPHEIPAIFLKETKLAMRSYIVEGDITLAAGAPSPTIDGFGELPILNGYVGTTPKATSQTVLLSDRDEPVLAHWQYGLGRSVAWTSDAKAQWAANWVTWDGFARFWTQVVRWAAAPSGDPLQIMTGAPGSTPDGGTAITVESFSLTGESRNGLMTEVAILGPDGGRSDVMLEQTGPGRYEGTIADLDTGAYLLSVAQQDGPTGETIAAGSSGLIVGYSAEFGPQTGQGPANLDRARQLTGGTALSTGTMNLAFAHDLPAVQTDTVIWPALVLLAILLLPLDIAIRRLAIGSREIVDMLSRLTGRPTFTPATSTGPAAHPLTSLPSIRRRPRPSTAPTEHHRNRTSSPPTEPPSAPAGDLDPPPQAHPGIGATTRAGLLDAKRRAARRQ